MSTVNFLTTLYVKVGEFHKGLSKGQTMTEYALILAAVAVVVFVTYEVMGQDITALVNGIDSDLSSASLIKKVRSEDSVSRSHGHLTVASLLLRNWDTDLRIRTAPEVERIRPCVLEAST